MRRIKGLEVKESYSQTKEIICNVNSVLETNFTAQINKTRYTKTEVLRFFMWLVACGRFDINKMFEAMAKNEQNAETHLRYILDLKK